MEGSNKKVQACEQVLEMIKEQLQAFNPKKYTNLSKSDKKKLEIGRGVAMVGATHTGHVG